MSLVEEVSSLQNFTFDLLQDFGLDDRTTTILAVLINAVVLGLICWVAYLCTRQLILFVVRSWIKGSKNKDLNVFIERKAFKALAHTVSGLLFYNLLPVFFNVGQTLIHIALVLSVLYILIMILKSISKILHALEYLAQRNEKYAEKPISSYVQVVLILCYLICGVLIVAVLFNRNPMTIITAFGAGMAIVLLIFRDLILGLVASVQLSVNDMVRVGDWISVHNYNADGEVAQINLTSVRVRNWDMTMANVPTYALISNGFKNVREMQDMGIRRLMHHLLVDVRSIKAVDDEFIENLKRKGLFAGEPDKLRWKDTKDYKFEQVTTNTNLSLFRRYMEDFLVEHPGIDNDYMVVRQLQQDGNGLPIEIYAFVKSVSFKPLNFIQSDIFEHLFSVMDDFELSIFQRPLGDDFKGFQGRQSIQEKS